MRSAVRSAAERTNQHARGAKMHNCVNAARKIAIIDTRKTDQKDKEGKKTEKMTTVGKKSDVDIM